MPRAPKRKPRRAPAKLSRRKPFEIGDVTIAAGSRQRVDIEVARPYGQAQVSMPCLVVHGARTGPRMFVSAAIHGDEILGVEIIRRLLRMPILEHMSGTLITVPIVNVYGFLTHSRYLPDRRDLNRSFPGSPTGSLAGRLAHVFTREVLDRSTHGIDLHTAASHRQNLPYVRAVMADRVTAKLAHAFRAPVTLNSNVLDGSLRRVARERNVPLLVYEASEPHRFDEVAIRVGVRGILNVMSCLGMITRPMQGTRTRPVFAASSQWVRAPESGVLRTSVKLGAAVRVGTTLGIIGDPLGDQEVRVTAPVAGVVIGRTGLPLVNGGDALFHIATFTRPTAVAASIEAVHDALDPLRAESPSGQPPIQ